MLLLALAHGAPIDDCLANADAQERYRCAYRVARSSNDYPAVIQTVQAEAKTHPDHGWALHTLGSLYTDSGKREQGVGYFERARARFDAEDDVLGRVYSRLNLGNHTYHLDRHADSSLAYTEAAQIAEANDRTDLMHAAKLSHARTLVNDGQHLGEAWALANAVHDQIFPEGAYQTQLLALHVLANIALGTGRSAEYRQLLERRIALAEANDDAYNVAAGQSSLAASLSDAHALGEDPTAPVRVKQLTDGLFQNDDAYFAAEAHCVRSALEYQLAQLDAATTHATACIDAFDSLEEPWSRAHVRHAFATSTVDPTASDASWAKALTLEAKSPEETAKLQLEHLELLGLRGDTRAIRDRLPNAMAAVKTLRELVGDRTSRSSLSSGNLKFLEMAALWLARKHPAEALTLTDVARGEPSDRSVDLEALQQSLPPDTTLVVPVLPATFDQGIAIVLTHDATRVVRLEGIKGIGLRIDALNGLIRSRDSGAGAASRTLHDSLIFPLELSTERVVFLPTGPLHRLSWAALHGPEGPLAARHVVSLERSLASWSSHAASLVQRTLVLGDPAAPADDLPPLPKARVEAQLVQQSLNLPGSTRLGERATADALRGNRADWLHVAAHGVVDHRFPEETALYLAQGERFTAADIRQFDWDGDIVVLSACRSAGGRVLGDRPLGLADAFHDGGASAVIGSLWPVRDADAAAFFETFYTQVSDGQPLDRALAATQRALVASGAPLEAWAGFVVLGDGSRSVPPDPTPPWWWVLAPLGLAVGTAWSFYSWRKRNR